MSTCPHFANVFSITVSQSVSLVTFILMKCIECGCVAVATRSPPIGLEDISTHSFWSPTEVKFVMVWVILKMKGPFLASRWDNESTLKMRRELTYSISATMTLHPSSAKRLHIASPKPEPPPVTIATFPSRRLPSTFCPSAILFTMSFRLTDRVVSPSYSLFWSIGAQ